LREINLNGYIDDEEVFGDEITPDMLRGMLYDASDGNPSDVHITLNSYGGSCNAATRMYDMIREYPGNVDITISGTAASAATVLASAGRTVSMTPSSLYMVHDPSTMAWGNERELAEAIDLLRACKESILNVYASRCKKPRDEIAAMMTATKWMDAKEALDAGFIDRIADADKRIINAHDGRVVNRKDAEAKVAAYYERQCGPRANQQFHEDTPAPEPSRSGVSFDQLSKRLDLVKPADKR
jgi:ATP-dependent Clp protease protease subunit